MAVLLVWLLHPLGTGSRHLYGNADAYFHTWNLWWTYQAIVVENHSPYYTTYSGFPEGKNLVFHNLILPLGLLSIPLFSVGLSASEVFLVWLYVVPIVGYLGMYRLLRRTGASDRGGAAAGIFWVLNPVFWTNLGRPDVYCILLLPYVVLGVLKLGDRPRVGLAAAVGVGAGLFLMSPYYAVGLLVLWGLGFLVIDRLGVPFRRYVWVGPLIALLTSFEWVPRVLGRPPDVSGYPFSRDLSHLVEVIVDVTLIPHERLASAPLLEGVFPHLNTIPGSFYLGITPLLIVLFFVWTRWSPPARWALGAGVLLFLVGWLPHLVSASFAELAISLPAVPPEWIRDSLKLFRAPQRLTVFCLFLACVGLGHFRGWSRPSGVLLLLVMMFELVPTPVWLVNDLPPERAFLDVKKKVEAPALVPFPFRLSGNEPSYGQTVHGLKFPMSNDLYMTHELQGLLASNPVTSALYRRKPPPEEGWDELKRRGYGGFIVHFWPRTPDADPPYSPPMFYRGRRLNVHRPAWRTFLEQKFGPPEIANRFFELYLFDEPGGG